MPREVTPPKNVIHGGVFVTTGQIRLLYRVSTQHDCWCLWLREKRWYHELGGDVKASAGISLIPWRLAVDDQQTGPICQISLRCVRSDVGLGLHRGAVGSRTGSITCMYVYSLCPQRGLHTFGYASKATIPSTSSLPADHPTMPRGGTIGGVI